MAAVLLTVLLAGGSFRAMLASARLSCYYFTVGLQLSDMVGRLTNLSPITVHCTCGFSRHCLELGLALCVLCLSSLFLYYLCYQCYDYDFLQYINAAFLLLCIMYYVPLLYRKFFCTVSDMGLPNSKWSSKHYPWSTYFRWWTWHKGTVFVYFGQHCDTINHILIKGHLL